jgi:hypothetical protein
MVFKEILIKQANSRAMLIFLGSYLFSICLTVSIHEIGHALALLILGYPDIVIVVTPFYGTTTSSAGIATDDIIFISAAGTVFDLTCASILLIALWHRRSTKLLPLLTYGGTAFLLEGVVMFNTFFTSTILTDWDAIIFMGISPIFIAILTGLVLIAGSLMMYIIWPLTGISAQTSFSKILYINLGYIIYILISIFFTIIVNLSFLPEIMFLITLNSIVAILFLILRILAYNPLFPLIDRLTHTEVSDPTKNSVWLPLVLGGIVFIVLIFF